MSRVICCVLIGIFACSSWIACAGKGAKVFDKSLKDGSAARLYKQSSVERIERPATVQANGSTTTKTISQESEINSYSFILTDGKTGKEQLVWEKRLGVPKWWLNDNPELKHKMMALELRDVTVEVDRIYVLYSQVNKLLMEMLQKNKTGKWQVVKTYLVLEESDAFGRNVTSAKFIGNRSATVKMLNGEVEEWSFASESPEPLSSLPKDIRNQQKR